MRITGGSNKGRILSAVPKSARIRPTSDKVREAIFSILGQDLSGTNVLDLFSGTGSLGLEALSRGAGSAVFIDHSHESIRLIRKNVELCGYGGSTRILKRDLRNGLPRELVNPEKHFDLVFFDPPYGFMGIPLVMESLSNGHCFSPGARAVVETSSRTTLPARMGELKVVDTRAYGDTRITLFMKKEAV